MKNLKFNTKLQEGFDKLDIRNQSYYAIVGCGGDLGEWVNGYNELLQKEEIGTATNWFTFKGSEINDVFNLQGDNRFKHDLTFLVFSLEDLNVGKLAIFKLKMGDRWLEDIIANSVGIKEQ